MKTSSFSFDLPENLIASRPPKTRGTGRLMCLGREDGAVEHRRVTDLPGLLSRGTVMVINDTRVRRARLDAINEATGGKGEFLFLETREDDVWDCLVDKAKKKRVGQRWRFPGGVIGTITDAPATDRRLLRCDPPVDENWFEQNGHVPLPPYIKRPDTEEDARRYQTVYAERVGSAAAPTAGLHLTADLLEAIVGAGIEVARITLHVGTGTFTPVRTTDVEEHRMHQERYEIPSQTAEAVNRAKGEGRPVLAVGTTAVRTLETGWDGSKLVSGAGSTRLFIYPGYSFGAVDQILTNFHTPESTLVMMISAFAGRENLLSAYQTAVAEEYRFFSYGDAMLIR